MPLAREGSVREYLPHMSADRPLSTGGGLVEYLCGQNWNWGGECGLGQSGSGIMHPDICTFDTSAQPSFFFF